jgi:S1-C subfamily serine protease
MKNTILAIVFSLFLAIFAKAQGTISTADKTFISNTLYPATGLLYSQSEEGSMQMRCTATAIAEDDSSFQFVTASHCGCVENNSRNTVSPEKTFFYISPDIPGNKVYLKAEPLGCGYRTRGDDYFLLKTDKTVKFPIITLGHDPKALDQVINVASPLGLGKQVFIGNVSGASLDRPIHESDIDWEGAITLQLFGTNGGSSGSSLVCTEQHAICGFIVGAIEETTIVAVPVSRFIKFRDALLGGTYRWYVKDPDAAPPKPEVIITPLPPKKD